MKVENELGSMIILICHQRGDLEIWKYRYHRKIEFLRPTTEMDKKEILIIEGSGAKMVPPPFPYLYINLACLSVWVSVCLFVSNKRQNG